MINSITRIEDLENILDKIVIGLHVFSLHGSRLWANKSEFNILGYNKKEYSVESIIDIRLDEDAISHILTILPSGQEFKAYPTRPTSRGGSIEHVFINSNLDQREGGFIHGSFTTGIPEVIYDGLRSKMD